MNILFCSAAMGDRTLNITRLLNHESVNMAARAVEWSGDDSPLNSSIGHWARLLQIISYTGSPLSSGVAYNRHGEDNEESMKANIYDRHAELEHWIASLPSHRNASECSLSMTMRSSAE